AIQIPHRRGRALRWHTAITCATEAKDAVCPELSRIWLRSASLDVDVGGVCELKLLQPFTDGRAEEGTEVLWIQRAVQSGAEVSWQLHHVSFHFAAPMNQS